MDSEIYWEILRRMTLEAKLLEVGKLNELAREFKAAGVRMQHPDWSAPEVESAVRKAFLHGRTH